MGACGKGGKGEGGGWMVRVRYLPPPCASEAATMLRFVREAAYGNIE